MGLKREQIIKALECCVKADTHYDCRSLNCPALINDECIYTGITEQECNRKQFADALSIIKELTEENERLRELGTTKEIEKEIVRRETRADTVRKMQEQIKAEIDYFDRRGGSAFINKAIVFFFIDQIAKEMIGEEND